MGRGPGKNNKTKEQLKEAKARRDAKFYEKNAPAIKKKNELAKLNAVTINCGCGVPYKDTSQVRKSHFSTQRHSLWDEEERVGVRQLICKKVKSVNTLAEAQARLDLVYFNADRFSYAQKEGYIPKLLVRLNKIADKLPDRPPTPPPPPDPPIKKKKLIIKKKTIIDE